VIFGRGSTISPGMMSGVAGASVMGGQGFVAGLGLDSQTVAVPEPSTLGLAAVGFGVARLLVRRRK
jgi:hypothetical protein